MTRAARLAVGVVVVVMTVAAIGASAQADSVLPRRGGTHHHHRPLEHDGSARVLHALGRLDRQLARSIRHRLSPLTDADRATIRANAALDQAAVEAVAAAYSTTPSGRHLEVARGLLRSYHPERYVRATAILRRGAHAADGIAHLQRRVPPDSPDGADLATAATLLTQVSAQGFTARTTASDMRSARAAVKQARTLVQQVRAGHQPAR
jgi:hypothetical protein